MEGDLNDPLSVVLVMIHEISEPNARVSSVSLKFRSPWYDIAYLYVNT